MSTSFTVGGNTVYQHSTPPRSCQSALRVYALARTLSGDSIAVVEGSELDSVLSCKEYLYLGRLRTDFL